MSADHVTAASHLQVGAAVLAVLAGSDLGDTAAGIGMAAAELDEAAQVYRAAGLAALERRAVGQWHQLAVEFPDGSTTETVGATQLGPQLDFLQAEGAVTGWWFLRKPPGWRLRVRGPNTAAVDRTLGMLAEAGTVARWWPTLYEPETYAFGGPDGVKIVHDLFCADSLGVLDYARRSTPSIGRRELSLVLINALLREAGLDWFERGDVFTRVAEIRPAPPAAQTFRVEELATSVRTLLRAPVPIASELFGPSMAFAVPWFAAFEQAGRSLGDAAAEGCLDRGLRAVLTHVVIFHWNRLGLSATTQGILAHAAKAAILPRS